MDKDSANTDHIKAAIEMNFSSPASPERIENPIRCLDTLTIMDLLKSYAAPKSKLTTMIKKGELIKIRRGLYLPARYRQDYDLKSLANIIHGPSVISFEYALATYGLIPERPHTITSATFNKNKNRRFETPLGTFLYRYVHPRVYPYGICRYKEGILPFLMASPEKALCDTISKINGISTLHDLSILLHEDLRVDEEAMATLDKENIKWMVPLYRKKSLQQLHHYLETLHAEAVQ